MAEGTAQAQRGGRLSGLIPLVVVGVIVVLFARSCLQGITLGGGSREADDTDILTDPTTSEEEADDPAAPTGEIPPAQMEPRDPECPPEDGAPERHLQWTEAPPMCIDPDATYTATLATSRGDIHIELDTENAPVTVNNFVFLARWRYYDGVEFHVVSPGISMQAGEPLGPTTGPETAGYVFEGEIPEDEPYYPLYSVAMGNTGEPDTNSSVFFIVTGLEAQRDPRYSRFGQINDPESQTVVDAIDVTGIPRPGHDGSPRSGEETIIHGVTITEE